MERLIWGIITALIALYVAFFLQEIMHELGHLLFGLRSGYQLTLFRIRGYLWMRNDNKICFRRLDEPEKGAECVMTPPESLNGKKPYKLYFLGGVICNTVSGIIFLVLSVLVHTNAFLAIILLALGLVGLGKALVHGIPRCRDGINNDGKNAKVSEEDEDVLRAIRIQMMVHARRVDGDRLKEMPDEWFKLPTKEGMQNNVIAVLGALASERLIDERRFEEADTMMEQLLAEDNALPRIHRGRMSIDRVYCELIGLCRPERIDRLMTEDIREFAKSAVNIPAIARTEFAYALLIEDNPGKARSALFRLQIAPCGGEVAGEWELLRMANEKYASQSAE